MAANDQCPLEEESATAQDFTCDACHKGLAQFFCQECSKCFCDNCVKLHKQLFVDHERVLDRGRVAQWPVSTTALDRLEICSEHKEKKIQMFCEDHSELLCQTCISSQHRYVI
ncbi:hypothetical protein DPMN_130066 [Dreissena polymorpha]|uniref:B box-type domain-containing protein n=1 Tax=Dreissena polymorpha TaxID=45954 RepID=A0A9D4H407_DREPO|nr:hypothetical protein DPMN_130066 [Dreissena polymorpha]